MPKTIGQNELDEVLKIVSQFKDGASVGQLLEHSSLSRSTLQRRLTRLVADDLLFTTGQLKGTRYRLKPEPVSGSINITLPTLAVEAAAEVYVPVSPESEALRKAVRSPLQTRIPVGYNREFLDDYKPNESFYLPEEIRQRLHEKGKATGQVQPAGTYVRKIFNRLLIDLSWNSSRLEGNTYSLLETERLLEIGESAEGKDAREAQMLLNHKSAIELLAEPSGETGFNRYTILNLHALLSENLLADPQACGRIREIAVDVEGTVFHPLEVPQMIHACFDIMLDKATAIENPFEQAFFIMVHLPYLQPFEDVNKRVSRLAANIPLVRDNLCPLSFVDVPQRAYVDGILAVYELNRIDLLRDVFVWAYERSCARYSAVRQSLGEPDPFRLRYRDMIAGIIAEIVRSGFDKQRAANRIRQYADTQIRPADLLRFVEVVEMELMGLHEGNIARYRLRPSEYRHWKSSWR